MAENSSADEEKKQQVKMKCTPIIGHFNKLILRTDS